MGNPAALALGAGKLRISVTAGTEPTDLATGWPANFFELGYTHEGSEFSYELETEPVEVAEELDAIKIVPVSRTIQVNFILAEITATNLKRALNGGTITTGAGYVTFEPPALGQEVRSMYGWESEDGEERWIFRKCLNGGAVTVARRKGAEKAGIAFELNCEKPDGAQPFKVIMASPNRA